MMLEKCENSVVQGNKEEIISLGKDWQVKISVVGVGNCLQVQLHVKMHVHASTIDGERSLTLKGTHTTICGAILKLILRDTGGVHKAVGYEVTRSVFFGEIGT